MARNPAEGQQGFGFEGREGRPARTWKVHRRGGRHTIDGPSVVYFLQIGQDGPIKIGCSGELSSRAPALSRQHGKIVCVLGILNGDVAKEHAIQRHFRQHHLVDELFRPDPVIAEFISKNCRHWDGSDMAIPKVQPGSIRSARSNRDAIPIGTRVGRLVVESQPMVKAIGLRKPRWTLHYECRCDCGNIVLVRGNSLRKTNPNTRITQSCGCLVSEVARAAKSTNSPIFKHGKLPRKLYQVYKGMIERCESPACKSFDDYGARGIAVCPEWRRDFTVFRSWAFSAGYREGLHIDRIDNDGDYVPENCRWVARKENNRNRRSNRLLEAFGETKCVAEWAEDSRCAVSYTTLMQRLNLGWDHQQAIQAPARKTTRLTREIVADIKKRLKSGERPSDLAKEYGSCYDNIVLIASGKIWTDV